MTRGVGKLTGGTVRSENDKMNEKVVGAGGVRQTDRIWKDNNLMEFFSCLDAKQAFFLA